VALGFGSTHGAGTTDRVHTTLTAHSILRTYAFWLYFSGGGGGGFGRVFDKLTGATQAEALFHQGGPILRYLRQWTSAGTWSANAPSVNTWTHVVITYDAGSTANDAAFFYNGVSQGVSELNTPSGSLVNNSDVYVLGNRGAADVNWDGRLAEWAVWDAILGTAEISALANGYSPLLIRPDVLADYVPMTRSPNSVMLGASTVTGTAVQPNEFRVVRPSAQVLQFPPPPPPPPPDPIPYLISRRIRAG
jgi:hypothetical protein